MHLISYVESDGGAHFLPPTDWTDGEFTWLCEADGRHYARVASLDYGAQAPGIDLVVHDLETETGLADKLDTLAVDRASARHERAERYAREMPIGDQLDAILKTLVAMREAGTTLPAETETLIACWQGIKADHPKPDLLPPAASE